MQHEPDRGQPVRRAGHPRLGVALAGVLAAVLSALSALAAEATPGDLSGLVLWLDAGDAATLALADDAGRIQSWRDKSPSAHLATAIDGLGAPRYLGAAEGAVRFDGTGAMILNDSADLDFQGTDEFTLLAVVRARRNGSILARTDGSAMQYRFHIPGERTLRVVLGQGGRQADTTSLVGPDGYSLLAVRNARHEDGCRFTLRVDGRDERRSPAGTGRVTVRTALGGRDEGRAQRLDGDLAELILYRRALSTDEIGALEAHLRAKHAGRLAFATPATAAPATTATATAPALPAAAVPAAPGPGLELAPEGTFTIAVIPDTQRYFGPGSGRGDQSGEPRNPAFVSRTQWLADNLAAQRIAFVSHVGDVVDRNNREQWRVAREAMDRLHGRVPYGLSVGNHDLIGSSGDAALFQEAFGATRFAGMPWYGGCHAGRPGQPPAVSGDNANSFQLITAAGIDLVVVHLECNAPDDVLAWADEVLTVQRHRLAIVTTHMYLGGLERPGGGEPQGRMLWKKVHGERGNTPQQLWEKCFSRHPNLFLVLCGDQSASIAHRQESRGLAGNPVHEILQDYPRGSDDSDWIRLLRVDPAAGRLRVITFSPAQNRVCGGLAHLKDPGQHQFELDIGEALAGYRSRRRGP